MNRVNFLEKFMKYAFLESGLNFGVTMIHSGEFQFSLRRLFHGHFLIEAFAYEIFKKE